MNDLRKQIQSLVNIFKSGNLLEAEVLAKKLIHKNDKIAFLYNFIGLIYIELKKIDLAEEYYKKGIKVDPKFAELYNNLGLIYTHDKPDLEKAESYFKKSISLNDKIPEPYNNLGFLYKSLDKNELALSCFNKSIEINANFFHSYHNIGTIYVQIGKFDEAKKNFLKAIELNPNYTKSHREVSRIINYTSQEKHLIKLIELYPKIKLDDIENKANIGFALGKAYEDIKNFEKSFDFYNQANHIYNKKINVKMDLEKENFINTKKTFHKEIYKKYQNIGNLSKSPIFILGMPRSGTTLLEQILSNHSKVYGAGEQDIINKIVEKKFPNKNLSLFFEGVVDFDENIFDKIGDEYIHTMNKISRNSERYTDKLPINFFWIGLIKLILPNCKIIHCYRNSKDNCFSIFKNHFPGGKINYAYDLKNIVDYYNLYGDLMKYWNSTFPNFILNIEYEKLISDTKNEITKILKFCDLSWDEKCLEFHKNKRPIKTASNVQVRKKIYSSSINIWKNYEKHLKAFFNKLNY